MNKSHNSEVYEVGIQKGDLKGPRSRYAGPPMYQ